MESRNIQNGSTETEEKIDPELERYMNEAQEYVDKHLESGFLANFAKDASLKFVFHGDKKGCYIDLETGAVNLPIRWFYERKMNLIQIMFAVQHEILHFRDLKEDSEGLMKGFEHIRSRAEETGSKMLEKWRSVLDMSDPEQKKYFDYLAKRVPINKKRPEKGEMSRIAMKVYPIHHDFFNALDDVWVNASVGRISATYEPGSEGGKEIERLYKEEFFKERDYSKLSRHRQFMNAILRDNSVSDEKVIVSDEVKEALERKITFMGRQYSVMEIVDNFIKPRTGRNTSASKRYFIIRQLLEPIFNELLEKDLEEWQPEKKDQEEDNKKKKGSEGEEEGENEDEKSSNYGGDPFEDEIKDAKDRSIDQISPEDMEAWKDKTDKDSKERKRQEEKENSPEERAKKARAEQDKRWAKKNATNELSEEQLLKNVQEFRRIEAMVAPYLEDLSILWRYIIYGKSRIIDRGKTGHFKSGDELDIQEAINRWPEISNKYKESESRIFLKMKDRETVINRPEKIRVRIVGDMSGSMGESKREVLKQVFVLLLSSLDEFNSYLNMTRKNTKTKMEVETEGYIFGSAGRTKKIKNLEDDTSTEMISVCSHLDTTIGGTDDFEPFQMISDSITEKEKGLIKSGKIMDIVFEVTDGGSTSKEETKALVIKLSGEGLIPRAFQVGEVSDGEKKVFDDIWNSDGRQFGEYVGTDLKALLPAIVKVLVGYLKDIQI